MANKKDQSKFLVVQKLLKLLTTRAETANKTANEMIIVFILDWVGICQ